MQFYLNGYKTGDPFIEDPHPSVAERPGGLVMCCGASPDRVLMRASQHRDGLAQFSIGRQLAMQVGVDSQNVGQQHRVGGIGFGSRHRIPGPIPRGGQRIDRIHRPPDLVRSFTGGFTEQSMKANPAVRTPRGLPQARRRPTAHQPMNTHLRPHPRMRPDHNSYEDCRQPRTPLDGDWFT